MKRVLQHIRPGGIILAHDGKFCSRWKHAATRDRTLRRGSGCWVGEVVQKCLFLKHFLFFVNLYPAFVHNFDLTTTESRHSAYPCDAREASISSSAWRLEWTHYSDASWCRSVGDCE